MFSCYVCLDKRRDREPTNCDSQGFNHRVGGGNVHGVWNSLTKEHRVVVGGNIIILIIIVLIIDSESLAYIKSK